jgi:hypothetical protein
VFGCKEYCLSSAMSDIYSKQLNDKLILLSLCRRIAISDGTPVLSQLMCSRTVELCQMYKGRPAFRICVDLATHVLQNEGGGRAPCIRFMGILLIMQTRFLLDL